MDIIDAIYQRKSIRGFRSSPVPKDKLTRVIEAACRAPFAMNTKPWEFVVLTGDVLSKLRMAIIEKLKKKEPFHPEHHVVAWPHESIYRKREAEHVKELVKLMDIPGEDKATIEAWFQCGFLFYNAPAGIIILTDKSLSDAGPLLDLGAVIQTICLAALNYGLGTCIEDQGVGYREVLRDLTGIPDSKKIVIAIAIGYPDWNFPANALMHQRESLENNTRWMGF